MARRAVREVRASALPAPVLDLVPPVVAAMKRIKLPTRKQMLRVLRASERELARNRPLTASQKMLNETMRKMLESMAMSTLFSPASKLSLPKNVGDTIKFRRYVGWTPSAPLVPIPPVIAP